MMTPSEQKTELMIYKAQIERELAQLQSIVNNNNFPEAIANSISLSGMASDYVESINNAIQKNYLYLSAISKKMKEIG